MFSHAIRVAVDPASIKYRKHFTTEIRSMAGAPPRTFASGTGNEVTVSINFVDDVDTSSRSPSFAIRELPRMTTTIRNCCINVCTPKQNSIYCFESFIY